MGINIMKKISLFFILFISAILSANPVLDIQPNIVATDDKSNIKGASWQTNLGKLDIDFSKIVALENGEIVTIAENRNTNTANTFVLEGNQFLEITYPDNRKKLFDGSLIIEFQNYENLDAFAISNQLELKYEFSIIKRAVFKIINLNQYAETINNLATDKNIRTIELNTLDPLIKPD